MPARAHETRPGYIEIHEIEPGRYNVVFRVPIVNGVRSQMYATFPENCRPVTPTSAYKSGVAILERTTIECAGGLIGGIITVRGLENLVADVLVRIQPLEGFAIVHRLKPRSASFIVPAAPSKIDIARTYLELGVEHILGGIDHLLFVLALLLLVSGHSMLLKTITAFTIAHSITLALATIGFVSMPSAPVEAVIALSILFLAAEIMRSRSGEPGLTEKYPWVIAFSFGLLHGLGFAGALASIGLPQSDIPLALLLFNVGVEIGQVLFVVTVLVLIAILRRIKITWPEWALRIPAYGIGSLAAFWCIQRIAAFW